MARKRASAKKSKGTPTRKAPQRVKTLSRAQIAKTFARQAAEDKALRETRLAKRSAFAARDAYKPRKSDRGKMVFIGTKGQRNPSKKGRKGYAIYVTKRGKKWFIRGSNTQRPFKARTKSLLLLPGKGSLKAAGKEFTKRRLVRVGRVRTVTKGTGRVESGGANDFSQAVSDKIAASVRKALAAQASQRIFLISFNALVRLPLGIEETISGQVPIEYPDHVAISAMGVKAYVRHKFYAFMARELAFAGYVSNGSANHIRRLADNKGKTKGRWKDSRGELWAGRNKEQVEIITIEWKIEQAK